MTTFALIRHASHGLVGHTIVGRMPGVPLSSDGRDEAAALARRLEGSPIQALYSSPLERARATAAPIADRLCLEVQIAEELNEIDFGQWTNRALADLREHRRVAAVQSFPQRQPHPRRGEHDRGAGSHAAADRATLRRCIPSRPSLWSATAT